MVIGSRIKAAQSLSKKVARIVLPSERPLGQAIVMKNWDGGLLWNKDELVIKGILKKKSAVK
jgi:hypothetical protein